MLCRALLLTLGQGPSLHSWAVRDFSILPSFAPSRRGAEHPSQNTVCSAVPYLSLLARDRLRTAGLCEISPFSILPSILPEVAAPGTLRTVSAQQGCANNSALGYVPIEPTPQFPVLSRAAGMWTSGSQNWQLPRLPPAPQPSPPSAPASDESADTYSNNVEPDHEYAVGPAPLDIDLDLSDRNIIPGKRRRQPSTRAVDAAKAKRAKTGIPVPRSSAFKLLSDILNVAGMAAHE
ncbi:hypothetical protein B0H13DRAFT_1867928 [Mycena leptocephala]|nr:hypothetical protein B0H13DRAFT_1867928 [Mycena leptocephala]